jgi:hypothetical protein
MTGGETSGPSLLFERAHHSDFAQAEIQILPLRRRCNDHNKAERETAPVKRVQTVLLFGNVCFLLAQKWPGNWLVVLAGCIAPPNCPSASLTWHANGIAMAVSGSTFHQKLIGIAMRPDLTHSIWQYKRIDISHIGFTCPDS